MKHIRLTVRPTDREIHPVHTLMTEGEFVEQAQMLHWNLKDFKTPAILFHVVGDAARVADVLAAIPDLDHFDLTQIDENRFYCYTQGQTTTVERSLYTAFTQDGLLVLPPLTYDDDGGVHFDVVGDPSALRAALDSVPDGISVTIEQIGSYETEQNSAVTTLTSRQREVVSVAKDVGYYDVPRTATIADVADELDCAKSTAAEHLQKAEAQVISSIV